MILSEKVKFNGINKNISPSAIDNGGNRMIINPIIDALNIRYLSSEYGDELIGESIRGNTKITNANLPAGNNKCIGWSEDKEKNCVYYFIYNSNNDHCIFKFTPETSTITLVAKKSEFNFQDDRRYLINSASVIGDQLIWNDGLNPTGCINTTRDYTYSGFEESHIRLIKKQPSVRPEVNPTTANNGHAYYRITDSFLTVNLIADKNYQFSYRLVFLDDENSNLAPYSILSLGERYPEHNSTAGVKIQVRITLSNAVTYAKRIQVLYREGTKDTWKVFKNLDTTSGSTYDAYYTGSEFIEEIPESESSKIFESIPNYSQASCIQKNRLFITENESGFDDDSVPSISISTPSDTAENILDYGFVPGGTKRIGLAVFDEFFRSIGVVSLKQFTSSWRDDGTFLGPYLLTHSFTSLTVGTGSKTWTIIDKELVKYAAVDMWVQVQPIDINPTAFGLQGKITSKNESTGTITVNVTSNTGAGSGTKASWVVRIFTSGIPQLIDKHNGINVTLSGAFSNGTNAKYYSIVRSEECLYEEYVEVPVRPYFYKFEKTGNYTPTSSEVVFDGKVFTKTKPSSGDSYSKVYIQLPREIPIALDTSFFVRFTGGVSGSSSLKTEKILEIDGDFVIVNNFGVDDWSTAGSGLLGSSNDLIITVAFYKLKTTEEITRYFEISPRYAINSDGSLTTTSFPNIGSGDCYVMSNRYTFRSFKNLPSYQKKTKVDLSVRSLSGVGSIGTNVNRKPPKGKRELLRRFLGGVGIDEVSDIKENQSLIEKSINRFGDRTDNLGKFTGDSLDAKIKKVLTSSDGLSASARNFIVDYTQADWSKGVQLIEVEKSKRIFTSDSKIRFSNKRIQDTRINGINSFDAGNAHSISEERGKIKRLIPVGNNVLAVHERACTTLYIEEGIIRAADGSSALITTGNVIGHDNKLIMEYGAYHGESVVKNDLGHVFGFDVYKGIAWRYTNEGLASISGDLDDYFIQKGEEYLAIKDTCRIIGGVDSHNNEFILTFLKDDGTGETWAYNYVDKKWQGRYSFLPEMYASVGHSFMSFKDGDLWLHNSSDTHNNFFGQQFEREIKIAVNPYPGFKKVFNGLIIAAQDLSEDNDEIIARFYSGDQESYCRYDEFEKKQNLHMGPILRDINTPNIDVDKIALRDGDEMRGDYLIVKVITSLVTRAPIQYLDVTYNKSEFSK